jgi:hypothetical protein
MARYTAFTVSISDAPLARSSRMASAPARAISSNMSTSHAGAGLLQKVVAVNLNHSAIGEYEDEHIVGNVW